MVTFFSVVRSTTTDILSLIYVTSFRSPVVNDIVHPASPVYFAEIGEGVDWTGVLDLTADNIAGPALQVIAPAQLCQLCPP